jgi:processive 1,2-diacylglycerol beta-glucosyltransferase
LTNSTFRRLYGRAYLDLVAKAPQVLGYFYDLMDRPPSARRKGDRLRILVERLSLRKFLRLLRKGAWDVVVNTHFLPAEMIASLRRRGDIEIPQLTATTDFETHRLWVNQPCEHYFTATEEGAAYLQHWGVPPGDTSVTGIPIHPAFGQQKDRGQCLARHDLAGDRPVVLQLAGGFGVGPVERLYRSLLSIETPMELVVVTGRNQQLKDRLRQIDPPQRHRAKVLGFTTEMDELMTAADLVVTKPGGLTSSEALASGAAMAVVNPIPGQESRNSDYLLENGAAVKLDNVATLPQKLTRLLDDPERLATLKRNARRLAKPQAAFDVARAALDWPGEPVRRLADVLLPGSASGTNN